MHGNSFSSSILSFLKGCSFQSLICYSVTTYLVRHFLCGFRHFLHHCSLCRFRIFCFLGLESPFGAIFHMILIFHANLQFISISFLITPHFTLLKTLTGDPFQEESPMKKKEGRRKMMCHPHKSQFIHLIDSRRYYTDRK